MITLYDCATAPSPRRARILLAEKGVEHATVQIDLARGEQLGAAFRAVNPQCTVPALVLEDGLVLTDNAAIAAYVEARWPEPALAGRSPAERAEVASWQWRVEFEGLLAVAEALRNGSPAMTRRALPGPRDYEQIPALAERGVQRVQHFFDTLEERLEGRETLAGEGFSIADITAVVAVDFARIVRVKPGEQHVNLRRWREAMGQRPSIGPAQAGKSAGASAGK
jgi:glutathione S-transferase